MFPSANVDQEYRISVALPNGYADTDEVYPVLYVLDANHCFGMVTETVRLLPILRELPEMIVVGTGYPVNSFIETFGFR
jgi:predicted alpha/beta superfamily hydrolase